MTQFAVHPGTGTYIALDECWFVDDNALPEGVDIEELIDTEVYDIPEDIPASAVVGFTYTVSDLDQDIYNGIVEGDFVEWLKAQPINEREFIVQNALQVLFTTSEFWNAWWSALAHSVSLSKRISENSTEGEPF